MKVVLVCWLLIISIFQQISIFDEEKKLEYKLCRAYTDPRMRTFDGVLWTAYLPGEFIMYRDRRRKISVSSKHISLDFIQRVLHLNRGMFGQFS